MTSAAVLQPGLRMSRDNQIREPAHGIASYSLARRGWWLAQMMAIFSLIQSKIPFGVIFLPIVYYAESRQKEHFGTSWTAKE